MQLEFHRNHKSGTGVIVPPPPPNDSVSVVSTGSLGCILDCSFLGDEVNSSSNGDAASRSPGSSKPSTARKNNKNVVTRLGAVVVPGSTHALDNDSRQPLLERHFGELLVRCIADYATKRAVDREGVYYAVFRVLSEKV
jgi:hypothetical protein